MDEPGVVRLRVTDDEVVADEWGLVLLAEEVPHAIERDGERFAVLVDADAAAWVGSLLDDYERERTAPKPPPPPETRPSHLGLAVALLLAGFHLALAWSRDPRWHAAGAGAMGKMIHGEPWRAITALTLHADAMHLVGNALACLVLLDALGRALGPGVAGALALGAGVLGNLADALLRPATHVTVGASTAVFGAVGILAGLALRRRRASGERGVRAWAPLAGGLALFGMLGTEGPSTDVLAHVGGLAAGALIGLGVPVRVDRPLRAPLQRLLVAATLAVIVGAWALARRAG